MRQNLGDEMVETRRICSGSSRRARGKFHALNAPEGRQPLRDLANTVLKDELVDRTCDHTTLLRQTQEMGRIGSVRREGLFDERVQSRLGGRAHYLEVRRLGRTH